jgi:hypothetical protein
MTKGDHQVKMTTMGDQTVAMMAIELQVFRHRLGCLTGFGLYIPQHSTGEKKLHSQDHAKTGRASHDRGEHLLRPSGEFRTALQSSRPLPCASIVHCPLRTTPSMCAYTMYHCGMFEVLHVNIYHPQNDVRT